MLKFFRRHSSGPLTKTLMLLLALTFILWGIGDTINRQNKIVAFKVADQEVTYSQWQEALSQQVRAIEVEIGKKLTPEEISDFGLQKMVLNQLINKMLLEKEATEMGLLVSDDMAKFEISSMPMFIRDGKFNSDSFYRFLSAIGSSEEQFVESMKGDIAISNLKLALTLNKEFPKIYTDVLSQARSVEKQYDLYTFEKKSLKLDEKINSIEATSIYEENKELFALPEMRNVSYLELSVDSQGGKISISDEQLNDAYEARKEIFESPESRSVLQMIFKDKVKAREALDEIKNGESFIKTAQKYFPKQKDFSLGDKITTESFDDNISDEVFGTNKNEVSRIVRSPLGFHIFYIKDIQKAQTKTFKEVKEQLRSQLIMEKKYDAFLSFVQNVEEDSLGIGSLEEVAQKHYLQLNRIDTLVPSDATNIDDMKRARFADIAFSLNEGEVSNAYPLDEKGNYFILQVLNVKPKEYKSLEAVNADVVKIWKDKKIAEKFANEVKMAKQKIVNGKSDSLLKHKLSKAKTIDWNAAKTSSLPNQLKEEILRANVGVVTSPVASVDGAKMYIAKVKATKPVEARINSTDLNLELAVSSMEVYLAQYLNYLRGKYDVQVFNLGDIE